MLLLLQRWHFLLFFYSFSFFFVFFFFNDPATTEIYTLSLHDALPILLGIVSLIFWSLIVVISIKYAILIMRADNHGEGDRKSTRLNSSHVSISYAVFCLKKKKTNTNQTSQRVNENMKATGQLYREQTR